MSEPKTGTAVGAIVLTGSDVLLLLHKASGLWELPGGKVRHGETIEEAVPRERLEETGLEGSAGRFGGILTHVGRDPTEWWCTIIYYSWLASLTGVPRLTEPDVFSEIRFWGTDALPENISPVAIDALLLVGITKRDPRKQ